jgi:hypothetical protein
MGHWFEYVGQRRQGALISFFILTMEPALGLSHSRSRGCGIDPIRAQRDPSPDAFDTGKIDLFCLFVVCVLVLTTGAIDVVETIVRTWQLDQTTGLQNRRRG